RKRVKKLPDLNQDQATEPPSLSINFPLKLGHHRARLSERPFVRNPNTIPNTQWMRYSDFLVAQSCIYGMQAMIRQVKMTRPKLRRP
ncbi:MAG: hypothetical protein SGJ20_15080, partial [Planctomycetota bacterium]|nr:hypothetical protein [Planctomycetota bacterium]